MCLIKKTIAKKNYYYLSSRHGGNVIQKYIGTKNNELVATLLELEKKQRKIPSCFWHLFWDANPEKISFSKNGRYIIERILELGSLEAFEWLLKIFSLKKIIEVFITSKSMSNKSVNFWMIWLGLKNA